MRRKSFLAVVLSLGMILQSVPSVVYAGEELKEDSIVQDDQTVTEAGIEEVHRVLDSDSNDELDYLEEEVVDSGDGYNRGDAVSYALSNWNKLASSVKCAEFAARSVKAGGISINPDNNRSVYNLRSSLLSLGFSMYSVEYSYPNVYSGGNNSGKIEVGDVLIYQEKQDDPLPAHASIVTSINKGVVKTTDRNGGWSESNHDAGHYNGPTGGRTDKGTIWIYCLHYNGSASIELHNKIINQSISSVTSNNFIVSGELVNETSVDDWGIYWKKSDDSGWQKKSVGSENPGKHKVYIPVNWLERGKTYNVYFYCNSSQGQLTTDIMSATTLDTALVNISGLTSTNVTENDATLQCTVNNSSGRAIQTSDLWVYKADNLEYACFNYRDRTRITSTQFSLSYRVSEIGETLEPGTDYVYFFKLVDELGYSETSTNGVFRTKGGDEENPIIRDVQIDDLSKDGYRISCVATDNVGVTNVKFPTWTEKDGNKDLIWHEGVKKDGRWYYEVKVSEHNNERGLYHTHIYAYDSEGNHGFDGYSIYVDGEPPVIEDYRAENFTKDGFDLSCVVKDDSKVKEVRFYVVGGGKGVDYKKIESVEGRYSCHVSASDFDNNMGNYSVTIYAADECQNSNEYFTKVFNLSEQIRKNGGIIDESEEGEGDENEQRTTSSNRVYVVGQKINVANTLFSGVSGANSYMVTNKKYASVNKKGVLKAKKAGTVVVKALFKAKGSTPVVLGSKTIRIAKKPKLKIKHLFHSYDIGEVYDLNNYLTNDGTPGLKVSGWTSSNPSVASVSSKTGKVRICGKGRTIITAHYGTIGMKGTVKVKAKLKVKK